VGRAGWLKWVKNKIPTVRETKPAKPVRIKQPISFRILIAMAAWKHPLPKAWRPARKARDCGVISMEMPM
jgi:hypothetical protein